MALYSARKGFNVGLTVGGINLNQGFHVMAGPCSVESAEQVDSTAAHLAAKGVHGAVAANPGLKLGVNVAGGQVTYAPVAEATGVPHVPVDEALAGVAA